MKSTSLWRRLRRRLFPNWNCRVRGAAGDCDLMRIWNPFDVFSLLVFHRSLLWRRRQRITALCVRRDAAAAFGASDADGAEGIVASSGGAAARTMDERCCWCCDYVCQLCSCLHLAVFAKKRQTERDKQRDRESETNNLLKDDFSIFTWRGFTYRPTHN